MRKPVSLILVIILLIACSGCFWKVEHDQRGYEGRDSGGYGDREHGVSDDQSRGKQGDHDREDRDEQKDRN